MNVIDWLRKYVENANFFSTKEYGKSSFLAVNRYLFYDNLSEIVYNKAIYRSGNNKIFFFPRLRYEFVLENPRCKRFCT